MLEFYQAYAEYQELMRLDRGTALAYVAQQAVGTTQVQFGGHDLAGAALPRGCRCARRRRRRRPRAGLSMSVPWNCGARRRRRRSPRSSVPVMKDAGPGRITADIFEHLWEDSLIQPTFVYDFPTEVSPLSKQRKDDPDTVERFELYIGGFELANAFSELTDPAEQRRRFEAQLAERDQGRSGSARDGRGLHPRARIQAAADRRAGHRDRSAGDGADQQSVDP